MPQTYGPGLLGYLMTTAADASAEIGNIALEQLFAGRLVVP